MTTSQSTADTVDAEK